MNGKPSLTQKYSRIKKMMVLVKNPSCTFKRKLVIVFLTMLGVQHWVYADQIVTDDYIVQGSLCVGTDCVNGENFNFDTIRLKENNVRIKFQDSSSTSSFPSNDWQLTANESANGGANLFSIEDITGTKIPFTIIAGAPNHSIYVRDNGNVGFNTSTPLVQLHTRSGNSPALRLEQDGSSGFTAQAWDISGNETNFFIRDVTNSSKIPFKITPGASNNSIFVAADGDIGFETATPDGIFDIAHPSDLNNHAVLLSSTANFGINIDNGFVPNSLFEIQSTGGVSEFSVAANGNTAINGTLGVTGDTTLTGNATLNSNIYLNTSGNVGVGVSSLSDFAAVLGVTPSIKIKATGSNHSMLQLENSDVNFTSGFMFTAQETMKWYVSSRNSFNSGSDAMFFIAENLGTSLALFQDLTIGFGGVQAAVAGRAINHSNGAYLSTAGMWTDASSREYKRDIKRISSEEAQKALKDLEPVTFKYLKEPGEIYAGFIAEDVPDMVASHDRKGLASMEVVAVLTRVVQEQQSTIVSLKERLESLELNMKNKL